MELRHSFSKLITTWPIDFYAPLSEHLRYSPRSR
jgi:hypothetical protein